MLHFSLSRYLLLILLLSMSGVTSAQKSLHFPEGWKVEDSSGVLEITERGDTLELVVPDGLTLWYKQRLTGDYEIRYRICMVMKGGKYDRLSDLNCFWAANDPQYPANLFARSDWRKGVFQHYNTLDLFYVGYGGNENSTTRFRRYSGKYYGVDENRIKPLLAEYTDAPNLLYPNRWYAVCIQVKEGITTFSVDEKELFRYTLAPNQGDGHFALRLLQNHVLFTNFQVKTLK